MMRKPLALSLVHKGFGVALIPLIIQVVLALSLSTLWRQTEKEGRAALDSVLLAASQGKLSAEQQNELRSSWSEQTKRRKQLNIYLIAAASLNVMFAVILANAFILGMLRKLSMTNESVLQFAEGKTLRTPLAGGDELDRLDRIFHYMAERLKIAQDQLSRSESRLRMLIETLPVGFLVLNENGSVEQANQTYKQSFRYTDEQLAGMIVDQLLPKLELYCVSYQEVICPTDTRTIETNALTGDGIEVPVEVSLRRWELPEGPRILVAAKDITERRKVERMRQDFVAMVTHDLRSPLTSIQLFQQLLRTEAFDRLPETLQETLGAADRSVIRLLNLVNDLLDLEKLEAGLLRLNIAQTRLSSVINRSMEGVETLATENAIKIQVKRNDAEIVVDEDRLIQVLVNLLSNAIKFSPVNSPVELDAKTDELEWLEISVRDYGRGIPQSEQSVIFERYHQIDPSDVSERRGTGLGLSICKGIVEQHGGTIGVESQPGTGSRFWFRIPKRPN